MRIATRLLAVLLLTFTTPALAIETPPSFADLVEKLSPAVVNISTTQKLKAGQGNAPMFDMPGGGELPEGFREFFDQLNRQQQKGHHSRKTPDEGQDEDPGQDEADQDVYSLGSGFIIDPSGYIATNNHVIADAEEVSVTLSDDTVLKAKIIGRDSKTDLALLKVEAGHPLPSVPLGNSDASRVGDWVIAIGNPFGLGGTVTAGIISARARNINAGPFDDFIQTDAAINRGNSGGPMFNAKGEVIGINTAIYSPSGGSVGIGFAVPMSLAKPVLDQLRSGGHINRGWLGVKIEHVSDEIADSIGLKKAAGALVIDVTKDGPADKAGVKDGDVVTKFDGKDVKEMRSLPRMVADTKIGKSVSVELWRKGQSKTVTVTLGELKDQDDEHANGDGDEEEGGQSAAPLKTRDVLGLSLTPLTPELREHYGIEASVKGVVITKVKPGTEAIKRGLRPADVITQVGETPTSTPADVANAVTDARKAGHKFVLARVQHGKESVFLTLPIEEGKK